MPVALVDGVGAVEEPVPSVAEVYHNRFVPVAVNGVADLPLHNCTGVLTEGADGNAYTVTLIAVLGLSHWPLIVWLT